MYYVSEHFAKRSIILSRAYFIYSLVSLSYDEQHVIVSYIILYDHMYYIIIMIFPSFIITTPDILIKKSLMRAQIHDNNSLPRVYLDQLSFYVLKLFYTSSVFFFSCRYTNPIHYLTHSFATSL